MFPRKLVMPSRLGSNDPSNICIGTFWANSSGAVYSILAAHVHGSHSDDHKQVKGSKTI